MPLQNLFCNQVSESLEMKTLKPSELERSYCHCAAQWYPPLERDGDVTLGSGDRQSVEVTCSERSTWTGLLNADGEPIHREPFRVGFHGGQ